jgi:hypothetical protein
MHALWGFREDWMQEFPLTVGQAALIRATRNDKLPTQASKILDSPLTTSMAKHQDDISSFYAYKYPNKNTPYLSDNDLQVDTNFFVQEAPNVAKQLPAYTPAIDNAYINWYGNKTGNIRDRKEIDYFLKRLDIAVPRINRALHM